MKIKSAFFLLFIFNVINHLDAQKEVRTFIFGHSLINHTQQINVTPSQETSVPHWFHLLAEEGGHSYAVGGQFGFLPQHANLPPSPGWGFDVAEGAWDEDIETFEDADFTNILITPGNFIQWQGPDLDYPTDPITPIEATNAIIDWCLEREDDLEIFIYENWPDMAEYLNNGFPPSDEEWVNYNNYLNGDFHNWFVDYFQAIVSEHPEVCVRMIPVGPVISSLLSQAPYNSISIDELYEDDAPHGRPTIYFLAALTTYMVMYEEKAPSSYLPTDFIHETIRDNYQDVVDHIWDELVEDEIYPDASSVFCSIGTSTDFDTPSIFETAFIFPNPSNSEIRIALEENYQSIHIVDILGRKVVISKKESGIYDVSRIKEGLYFVEIKDLNGKTLALQRFLKTH